MANYYDGARAEEARRLHTVTTGPYSETVASEPSPTLGELLEVYHNAYGLRLSDGEIAELSIEIKRRVFGPSNLDVWAFDHPGHGIVDAEVIDDDR